jgi:hypothetical protein
MAIKAKRDTSKALREFWKPKGALHKRNANRLKTWLRKHGGNVDIATFIHSPEHEEKRSQAITKLFK